MLKNERDGSKMLLIEGICAAIFPLLDEFLLRFSTDFRYKLGYLINVRNRKLLPIKQFNLQFHLFVYLRE